jgi:hypothetical protein
MFTAIVFSVSQQCSEISVHHFETQAEAQAFQPQGINCTVQCSVVPGHLSEEQAVEELLW